MLEKPTWINGNGLYSVPKGGQQTTLSCLGKSDIMFNFITFLVSVIAIPSMQGWFVILCTLFEKLLSRNRTSCLSPGAIQLLFARGSMCKTSLLCKTIAYIALQLNATFNLISWKHAFRRFLFIDPDWIHWPRNPGCSGFRQTLELNSHGISINGRNRWGHQLTRLPMHWHNLPKPGYRSCNLTSISSQTWDETVVWRLPSFLCRLISSTVAVKSIALSDLQSVDKTVRILPPPKTST